MKRIIVVVLVLAVIGIGFYLGYRNAIVPNRQSANGITKSPSPGSIIISNPTAIPANALTRETTMVVNLDTPTTIFKSNGSNSDMEITVKLMPTSHNTGNKKQFLVEMPVTTPPPSIRVISPRVVTMENQQFSVAIGGSPAGNVLKGSSIKIDGIINPVDNNQVKLTLKLSSW